MAPKRLSGLQKSVLALYRSILRAAAQKDRAAVGNATSRSFTALLQSQERSTLGYARLEFRNQATAVRRSDFKKIEYMIRKGEKHLKLLRMPGTKVVTGAS